MVVQTPGLQMVTARLPHIPFTCGSPEALRRHLDRSATAKACLLSSVDRTVVSEMHLNFKASNFSLWPALWQAGEEFENAALTPTKGRKLTLCSQTCHTPIFSASSYQMLNHNLTDNRGVAECLGTVASVAPPPRKQLRGELAFVLVKLFSF